MRVTTIGHQLNKQQKVNKMVSAEFKLTNGKNITVFLSNNFALVESEKDPSVSVLSDGVNNNGGWKLACPYEEAKRKIELKLAHANRK